MTRRLRTLASALTALGLVVLIAADEPANGQDSAKPDETAKTAPADDTKTDQTATSRKPATDPNAKVVKSLVQWRKQLSSPQFLVTRMKATEPAFSGRYASGHFRGTFVCVCCGAELFSAAHKFESGTGWPSFYRPINNTALASAPDYSDFEPRLEVKCARCDAHLGHVFPDGPPPTGQRFCINSLSLKLVPPGASKPKTSTKKSTARPAPSPPDASDKPSGDAETTPETDSP